MSILIELTAAGMTTIGQLFCLSLTLGLARSSRSRMVTGHLSLANRPVVKRISPEQHEKAVKAMD